MEPFRTGHSEFRYFREEGAYYVDKTLLVKDLLDNYEDGIFIMTHPRGFGNTMNLSMLDAFFNVKYKDNSWFDGLAISEHHEYDEFKNAFPVVRMDMSSHWPDNYDKFLSKFRFEIREVFGEHRYLLEKPNKNVEEIFKKVDEGSMTASELMDSLMDLANMLAEYHGVNPVVLIDYYDRPLYNAFGDESYEAIHDFMRILLSRIELRSKAWMVYVSGVVPVSTTYGYRDDPRLTISTVTTDFCSERFGLTRGELEAVLEYRHRPEMAKTLWKWYGGYRFGQTEICNLSCVFNCINWGWSFSKIWADSYNTIQLRNLRGSIDSVNYRDVLTLVSGGSVRIHIGNEFHFSWKADSGEHLYQLMVASGYLRAVQVDDGLYDVSFPNSEVLSVMGDLIRTVYNGSDYLRRFDNALMGEDAEVATYALKDLIHHAAKELRTCACKGIVAMWANNLVGKCNITVGPETHRGRIRIIAEPKQHTRPSIVMEVCDVGPKRSLKATSKAVMKRIVDDQYHEGKKGRTVMVALVYSGEKVEIRIQSAKDGILLQEGSRSAFTFLPSSI